MQYKCVPAYQYAGFQFYRWSKKGNLIGFCLESRQTFDCPLHTLAKLDFEQKTSYECLWAYNLYLSVSLNYYTVTNEEVLSYEQFKEKYYHYVHSYQVDMIVQLRDRLARKRGLK